MHAILVEKTGGPEVLRYTDWADPEPGQGEVLIDIAASGVNFIDTYRRSGAYPMPTPFVLGEEGAGTIAAVGAGVTDFKVGDRVGWAQVMGSYAERAVVPAARLVRLPDRLDAQSAAAALLQGMTAHYLTHSTYDVQPGDNVLVHAAAGGMGLLLTQLVKLRGGRVIGTVSTAEKEQLAREAGADEVIRYTEVDFVEQTRRLTGGEGVAVVYDGVGKDTYKGSLASLRPRGLFALYGQSSGRVPPIDLQDLNTGGSLFATRPTLGNYLATREELDWRASDVLGWVESGKLHLHIGRRYELADARTAHEDLEGRRTTGKLLLIP